MKHHIKSIAGAAVAAFLTLGADSLRADVTNLITISATALMQGTTNVSKGVATVAKPVSYAITTKQVLAWLAQDEYAESNYPAASFPTGAQLAVITSTNADSFQVLDKHNNFLVDVSDILSGGHGSNYVYSGKINVTTGVYESSVTSLRPADFYYNDLAVSAIPGRAVVGVDFYVRGLDTRKYTDSTPNTSGVYTEIINSQVVNGLGEGIYQGTPILVTGGFGYSGVATLKD